MDQAPSPMIAEILAAATHRLQQAGVPDPRLDAELFLTDLLQVDRAHLVLHRMDLVPPEILTRFESWIERRERREPLQHILGWQEFYGLAIRVDRRVLVPRPETEVLVEAVLELELPRRGRVADLGTGSGCIPVALGMSRDDLRFFALDRSADALEVARENARLHGLEPRIELVRSNLASPPAAWRGTMDAVVSNPPYVPEADWKRLQPEVRDYDPREALIAGPSGLEAFAALVPVAFELLRDGGWLVFEIGFGQLEGVRDLVRLAGLELREVRPDLHQIPRVIVARKPPRAVP